MGSIKRQSRFSGSWPAFVIGVCFLAGGILGCLFGAVAAGESAQQLGDYLRDYLSLAEEGALSWSIPAVLWNRGRWLLLCALLGLTGLGVAGLPVLFGVRGFFLAFGVSCFVRFIGGAGLVPALVLFALPALLWAPGFFAAGILGIESSMRMLRRRTGDAVVIPGNNRAVRYGVALSLLLLILCVILECGLLPTLLPWTAQILG